MAEPASNRLKPIASRFFPPPRRILLVRLSAIGDVLFASPLIGAFRRAYPDAYLAWLAQPACAPLVRHHPELDEVIEWPYPRWRELLGQRRWGALRAEVGAARQALRARRFDLAVDLQGLLKSALPTWLSGAPRRIGLGSREGSRWLMTESVDKVAAASGARPPIGSEYRRLATALGLPTEDFRMRLEVGAAATGHIAARLAAAGLTAGFIAICPFTTRPQKHWPESSWSDLIRRIERDWTRPVLMLGGPGDRPAAARIAVAAGPSMRDWVGQTSLLEAAAAIARADALVGVDTGLGHMGIALGRPTLLLFGATRPYLETGSPRARVMYRPRPCSPCRRRPSCAGRFDCMREIGADEVLRLLARIRNSV